MAKAKLKALSAQGRTGWANAHFQSKERELRCVRAFVFNCPVPGTSIAGGRIDALERVDNSMAKQALDSLFDSFPEDDFFCHTELRQVAKTLIKSNRDEGKVPKGGTEFAVFAKSPVGVLKDSYGLYSDRERKSLKVEDLKPYSDLLTLDAVYRHIRNAFAHGLFTEVRRKSSITSRVETFLYLQDNNSKGQISARFFLSYVRMERLMALVKLR